MKNSAKERKMGVLLSYLSIILNTIVQLAYTPFLIKSLGQSEYGLYSLIASIIGYLTVLDLGFGNALVVYTAKYHEQKKYNMEKKLHGMFLVIFQVIGVFAAFLGLVLFFGAEYIFGKTMSGAEIASAKIMMLILSVNLLLTFSFSIYSSIITAYERFSFQKITAILSTILKPLLMTPLLLLGVKSVGMCIIITIVNVIILLLNYTYCRKKLNVDIKFTGFDKELFKEIFGYSIFIFLAVIVDKVNWSLDQFILGAVSGTIAVSLYAVASQLNSLFINLSTSVSSVLLPKMSKMIANKASDDEISEEFIKVGRIQFLIIFLMASGLVLFGKEFMITWAGQEYSESYYIALILILPFAIPLIQNLGLSIMQAKNLHKFRSILCTIIALGNVMISIPLAKYFGGIGSAIGTSLALIIGNIIIMNIYYYKKVGLNIPEFWRNILKMIIPFTIPIVIILIIMHFITLHGYINLIIFGGLYTILYILTSYFLVMNEYEKSIINKVLIKLKLKK